MTKDEVIEKIKLYEIPTEQLIKIDSRLHIYVDEVLNNPNHHNKYEILAVFRFLDFLKRDDLIFNIKEIKKFIVFYEHLNSQAIRGCSLLS